jgi:2-polyprenyl-3-methyl-5-hydroxy-6-metoxy-1,4-benzoquinol methylase
VAEHNGLGVVRCNECGHGYVWPVPDADFIDAIYHDAVYYRGSPDSIGFRDYASLEGARRRMYDRHLSRIEQEVQPGRILDVGCATGDFLKVARSRGWDVLGVDPSAARELVQAAGIALVGRTVHDAEVAEGQLDAISFWDVLEHLPDPVADLVKARQLLRPGGVVAVTVPDSANYVARLSGRRWFGYKTAGEHLQFFTKASLQLALEKAHFSVRTSGPTTWSCTLGFIADRSRMYFGPLGRLVHRPLSNPRLSSVIIDVPQVNQFALGIAAPVAESGREALA